MKLFKCKFAQAPLFLTFEQSFMFFLQLKKTIHDFFSSNLVKQDLDLDPDPDPHKVNADLQPWFTTDGCLFEWIV